MALSLPALQPVTADRGLLVNCVALIGVIGGSGILTRRLLRNELLAATAQAAIGLLTLAGLALAAGLPGPSALATVLADGLAWTMTSTAPMEPNLGVRLIATAAIGVLAFLADQLAVTHGYAAWTLLPFGVPYLLTAMALPDLASLGGLLGVAAGYLLVLLADTAGRVPRAATSTRPGLRLLAGGLACLLAGMSVAVVVGLATPGVDTERGTPFGGRGPIQMGDPSLDLRRNLQQPEDRRVLSYTTDTGSPAQLRLTALPVFDAGGFHLTSVKLDEGALPAPPGAPPGRPRYQIDVTVDAFTSEWLPLPYAPAAFEAAGTWRHDPLSLSVIAVGDQRTSATNGLRYRATIVNAAPTAAQVAAAHAGTPADGGLTVALPDDLPPRIRALAEEITRKGTTDGRRAVLIQNWLRSPAFSYSTEPAPGSGYDALTRFLFEDRIGYCEQFAGSMAVLARAVGIPARVAVGFLPGNRAGEAWEVNVRSMHAWPELYFDGLGWVAFEPTPAIAEPPGYAGGTTQVEPSVTPTPTQTAGDDDEPSVEPEAPAPEPDAGTPEPAADAGWPGWGASALGVAALAAVPSVLRGRRRAHRLAAGPSRAAVAGAWDEIRDSVWDAGREWPRGSARQIAATLAADLPAGAGAALTRVALLVEQARYADDLGEVTGVSVDVEQVRAGLAAGATGPRKLGRELLPRSLWRRLRWRG
ncbi:MAG: transglutaminaseTgpA domain-containing protein [Micropruina sp.]